MRRGIRMSNLQTFPGKLTLKDPRRCGEKGVKSRLGRARERKRERGNGACYLQPLSARETTMERTVSVRGG